MTGVQTCALPIWALVGLALRDGEQIVGFLEYALLESDGLVELGRLEVVGLRVAAANGEAPYGTCIAVFVGAGFGYGLREQTTARGVVAVALEVELDLTLAQDVLALILLFALDVGIGREDARQTGALADVVPVLLDVGVGRILLVQSLDVVEQDLRVADVDRYVFSGQRHTRVEVGFGNDALLGEEARHRVVETLT